MTRAWILVGAISLLSAGCGSDRDRGIRGGADAGPVPGAWTTCERPASLACAEPLGDGYPLMIEGNTEGVPDEFGGASCGGGGDGVPDAAFQWTAPAAGPWTFSTHGTTSFDTVLYVRRDGCGAAEELGCNDDAGGGGRHSVVTVELEACETVTVVVDGFSADQHGPFQLRVSGVETNCSDGIDDDGDGSVDCDDIDCFGATCPGDDAWPADWVSRERRVLELANAHRASGFTCGGEEFPPAGPLEMDEIIQVAARLHSTDMGEQGYFDHDSLDGRTFSDRMTEAGFTGGYPWGENIAAGQATPEQVMQGWMASPGHCRNIMNAEFNVIGIGYANVPGSDPVHYWTQDFAGSH